MGLAIRAASLRRALNAGDMTMGLTGLKRLGLIPNEPAAVKVPPPSAGSLIK